MNYNPNVRPFRSSPHAPAVHSFQEKHEEGKKVEKACRDLLGWGFPTTPADRGEQRRGIDFWVILGSCTWVPGARLPLEVKADFKAAETGKAFIETVSVMQYGEVQKLGWVHTCQSPFILFCVPAPGKFDFMIHVLRTSDLRAQLPAWEEAYGKGRALNKAYGSDGVLLPLPELARVAVFSGLGSELNTYALEDRAGFQLLWKEVFACP